MGIGNLLMVEHHFVVHDTTHQICHARHFFQHGIQVLHLLPLIERTSRYVMSLVLHNTVGCPMVGREENQIVPFSDLCVEETEEISQLLVKFHILCMRLFMVGTKAMSYDIRTREAQCEHIGLPSQSQTFVLHGRLGHSHGNLVTIGFKLDKVDQLSILVFPLQLLDLPTDTFVVTLHPLGQILHVISTGDKAERFLVEPVGRISTMTCGQDSGTVLEAHTNHLRLPVRGCLQFITNGSSQHIPRRHQSCFGVTTNCLHGRIRTTVSPLTIEVVVITSNTMDTGHTTGEDTGMTDSSH